MAHRGRLLDRITTTTALVSAVADKLKLTSGVTTWVNIKSSKRFVISKIQCSKFCLKLTFWSSSIRINRYDIKIIWKLTNAHSCWHQLGGVGESVLILGWTTIVQLTLVMISAAVIETSVTITDNLQSQLLRGTFTWKIKLRCPEVQFCSHFALFNTS